MKSKLGKILLIVIPLIVAGFLLYPTYDASQLEKIENEYKARAAKAKDPADSMKIIEEFEKKYGEDLERAKKGRLKLGLDLRGGMYVTLEADVAKLIEETAIEEQKDEIFKQVMDATNKETAMSEASTIDIFLKHFDQIARPKKKYLADYFDFNLNEDLAKAEQSIEEKLRENETEAVEQAIQVIRQRVDKYGISEPTIQKQGSRRILLELPGVQDEKQMLELVKTTARLEFKAVANDRKLAVAFYRIDKLLANKAKIEKATTQSQPAADSLKLAAADSTKADSTKKDTTALAAKDSTKTEEAAADTTNPYEKLSKEEQQKQYLADHPFTTMFTTFFSKDNKSQSQEVGYINEALPEGEYNFVVSDELLPKVKMILNRPEVKALLPDDITIHFAAKAETFKDQKGKDVKFFNFYACKDFQPKLTGEVITDAVATYDQTNNQPIVNMAMDSDGSERWAKITGANIGKRIAVILDDQVYTAPNVQARITGGSSQITGMANPEEARLLKIVLKAGALKAPVQTAEVRVVGPSLGEDSIASGFRASMIAFALVILFMLIYYVKGGLVADIAIFINVLLILAVMAAFDGTLTLPGIAGIILTIGMAVDANILIYERIREELFRGRTIKAAIDEGFKKALSAILDSNVTTFITALILFYFGTGTIQGFAMTLMIGILGTLFTAILVSRALIELTMSPSASSYNFGQPKLINNQD